MQLDQYQTLAARTLQTHLSRSELLLQFALGIAGEAAEVSELLAGAIYYRKQMSTDDLEKEMGDIMWYASQLAAWLDLKFSSVVTHPASVQSIGPYVLTEAATWLGIHAGAICDYVKKVTFHGHPVDQTIIEDRLVQMLRYLQFIGWYMNLPLERVGEANIEKQRIRYPNGFEAERSINRVV